MRTVLATLIVALLLAGCGKKSDPVAGGGERERFTLVLDYFPNADHAPIYAAQAAGEFEKAGLDLEIRTPPDPAAPLRLLQGGRADLVVSYEPEVLLARDKSHPAPNVVAVGALVQKPLTSLMSLSDEVKNVGDLRGKRVGTAGIPYQDAYLDAILDKAGVPRSSVDRVNVGFNFTVAMIAKRVDATLGAFWNYEGTDLMRRGRTPTILRMEQLGVPTYAELVFAARRKSLDTDGASRVRRFLAAVARGAQLVEEDPEAAADALVEANRDLDRRLQLAVIEKTLPLFTPRDPERPFGWQDPNDWIAYGRWMRDRRLLEHEPQADAAMTNEFLPGEGLQTERTEY